MYLDGVPLETEVVRDQLVQGHHLPPEAGDDRPTRTPLTIGARFRDSGFKNGLIDDLQIFDVA